MTAEKAAQYDLISLYYDLFKEGKRDDYLFYSNLAHETGGPVLELACGTGRLLIELAEEGFEVVGVDISRGMLTCAEKKLEQKPESVRQRVTLVEADVSDFVPKGEFALIFIAIDSWFQIGTAEDRLKVLRNCKSHLKPYGCFALDAYVWDDEEHEGWGERQPDGRLLYDGFWRDPFVVDGVIQRFRSDVIDPTTLHLKRTVFCDHVTPWGQLRRVTLTDDEYYLPPARIEEELKVSGFTRVDFYGGFNKEPLYDPALKGKGRQVIIARV